MHVLSRYIGWRSNNVAEYFGLISAVKYARSLGATELEVFSDSKLVVKQVQGGWRVKSDDLKPFNREAKDLLSKHFPNAWSLTWVSRKDNTVADEICTAAIYHGMFRNPWVRRHMRNPNPGKIVDPFRP